jgi:DNA primase
VELPDLTRTAVERVQSVLNAAWTFYTARPLHAQGVSYLARRGIDVEMLEDHNRRYEVGHTPTSPRGLVDWMGEKGFAHDELVDAGLAHRSEGHTYINDFYRDRVLIPIRDHKANLSGFVGRNIGNASASKYINPTHTLRYDKSICLYQPLPAPERPAGRVIVVEGTLDAMAIAVAAIRVGKSDWYCPVTQSGRQLSLQQLRYVLNLHDHPPLLAMDADQPGRESNARLQEVVAALGKRANVVDLPDGHDPASWLAANGADGLEVLHVSHRWDSRQRSCTNALIRHIQSASPAEGNDPIVRPPTVDLSL